MIAFIRGKCVQAGNGQMVLENGGLGYRILVTSHLAETAKLGADYQLHTQLIVRENEMFLVGFTSPQECEVLKVLITISGVGPKLALKILSALSPAALANCVLSEDTQALTKVPGIGARTAKRLLLELSAKIGKMAGELGASVTAAANEESSSERAQALSVLMTLGCTEEEAQGAIKKALVECRADGSAENLVMAAMKALGEQL